MAAKGGDEGLDVRGVSEGIRQLDGFAILGQASKAAGTLNLIPNLGRASGVE